MKGTQERMIQVPFSGSNSWNKGCRRTSEELAARDKADRLQVDRESAGDLNIR